MQKKEGLQFVALLCGLVVGILGFYQITKRPMPRQGPQQAVMNAQAKAIHQALIVTPRSARRLATRAIPPKVSVPSVPPIASFVGSARRRGPTSRRAALPLAMQRYTSARPKVRIFRYVLQKVPPFSRKERTWAKQLPTWRAQMRAAALKLRRAQVGKVLLVHGTFVGKDPFGVVHLLAKVVPFWKPSFTKRLVRWNEQTSNAIFKDGGNWVQAHVSLLREAFGKGVQVSRFPWTSRNDHLARLQGALRLIKVLAGKSNQVKPGQRIVLLGHSHAGQLFALITHFLCRSRWAGPLLAVGAPKKAAQIERALVKLRRFPLTFVTMGTPPRYTWARCQGTPQLLHIVNHRGKGHLAGTGSGVLTTKAGDYVQQWGIVGSDLISAIPSIFKANQRLAKLLGPGADPLRWFQAVKRRMRLHHRGTTLLVDYRDQSSILPNFGSTVMGHAVYTRLGVLLFNLRLLTKHVVGGATTRPRQ